MTRIFRAMSSISSAGFAARFRPRPKRSRRPLWGDAEGTAKREWSWPEDMAAGPKEDSREQPEVAEDD